MSPVLDAVCCAGGKRSIEGNEGETWAKLLDEWSRRRLGTIGREQGIPQLPVSTPARWHGQACQDTVEVPSQEGKQSSWSSRRYPGQRTDHTLCTRVACEIHQLIRTQSTSQERSPSFSLVDRPERRLSSSDNPTREPRSDPTPTPSLPALRGTH